MYALLVRPENGGRYERDKEEGMRGEEKNGNEDRSYVLTTSDALSDRKQLVAGSGGRGKDAGPSVCPVKKGGAPLC